MKDDFHGIEATKRRKQNELLLQLALLYLCFQLLLKSVGYFTIISLRKVKADEETVAQRTEISLIRLNWICRCQASKFDDQYFNPLSLMKIYISVNKAKVGGMERECFYLVVVGFPGVLKINLWVCNFSFEASAAENVLNYAEFSNKIM